MADFNSRFTGAEIEAAIEKTNNINEYYEVWAGAPTDTPIPLSTLPANPKTGDRTGLYHVLMAKTNQTPGTGGNPSYLSVLYVSMENGGAVGSSHIHISSGVTNTHTAVCYNGEISGIANNHHHDDNTIVDGDLFIHKIYREQQA